MDLTDVPYTSLVTAVAVVVLSVIYYAVKNINVLPGPRGVPYLGLYPFLTNENFHLKLDEYKKEYGDLFSFTYAGQLFINMGSVKAIRELHLSNSESFAERPSVYNIFTYMLGKGVTMINGEPWKVLRKFFIQKFRDHGLNTVRENMAGPVYDTLNATIDELKASKLKPVNLLDVLTKGCSVTMRKIVFGEEGISDKDLQALCIDYGGALEGMMGVNMLLAGPLARLLFTINPNYRKSLQHHQATWKTMFSCSKKIERSLNNEHSSCIIEDFYKERNDRRRKNDPTWKYFTDEALVESALQFIGDGIVGAAAFIAGFLNAAVLHPEEQDKLYAELVEVVGPNRQPVLEDRSNLPYFSAFTNEVLRFYTFLNMFPSLLCTKETTLRGYRIPKGSITLLNFWSAHHDSNTFEDPDSFNPSRYMPSESKSKVESPIIFGIGKRSCSGENFVMTQVFLLLATIVKNFKVSPADDPTKKSLNYLITGKLELIFHPRTEN